MLTAWCCAEAGGLNEPASLTADDTSELAVARVLGGSAAATSAAADAPSASCAISLLALSPPPAVLLAPTRQGTTFSAISGRFTVMRTWAAAWLSCRRLDAFRC